jgi:hypothetical protein
MWVAMAACAAMIEGVLCLATPGVPVLLVEFGLAAAPFGVSPSLI